MFMSIKDDLRFISATIDANLRYAESKHATFIAFNGLATFGGFGLLRNISQNSNELVVYFLLSIAVCLLICALLISMYSFIPVIIHKKAVSDVTASSNALFFEHVKLHSVESYERLLCEQYQVDPANITPLDRCVISQLIVNAHLASRKFTLFKRAIIFDMAALAFALVGAILVLALRR